MFKVSFSVRTALVGVALLLTAVVSSASAAEAPSPTCLFSSMYVVAHEDDTLLFQSPSVLQDIQTGRCVRTVFLTAGDDGRPESYWGTREEGAEAAYAQMAGVPNDWAASEIEADGHPIHLETLVGQPGISLVFMRLPDGGVPGEGTQLYGYQSLLKLWDSGNPGSKYPAMSSITAVDGSSTYSYQGLIETLASLIKSFKPQLIATQNFREGFFEGDHPDHIATAYFTKKASELYEAPHQLVGYEDYDAASNPQNVFGELLGAKSFSFYTYGLYDSAACSEEAACESTAYAAWLERQYIVGTETVGIVANAGYAQIVSPGASVALDGSQSSDASGRPLSYEWTQTGGPSVVLSSANTAKPSFVAPSHPVLLTFSLTVAEGLIGSKADTVTVRVPGTDPTPTAVAGPPQAATVGATVTLDGSSSFDPNGLPLEYAWTQVAGPSVSLSNASSAKPSFIAPPGPSSLTFSLVVSNGTESSAPSTVAVEVEAEKPIDANVALLATATASSESTSSGQTAKRAIDGVIGGYPSNPTAEWATEHGKAGSWLMLKWSKSYVLDHVVLYDRPNTSDQITSGKLTFSDGSSVNFGSLPNTGSPGLVVSFPPHPTTSLQMTVSSVSSTTLNVGLAEIQAWGVPAQVFSPTMSSGASTSFTTGTAQSFTVRSDAYPTAALSESGALPSGIKFVDNGDGTGTLSGTPAPSSAPAGSSKVYPIAFTAANGVGTTSQNFALTVVNNESPVVTPPPPPKTSPPTFTTPSTRYGVVGKALSIPIEAAGTPVPTLSLSGSVPRGLRFTAASPGKATISGTPTTVQTSHLTVVAKSSAGTTSQALTLVIERQARLSNTNVQLLLGRPSRHVVKVLGSGQSSIRCSGALPKGARCLTTAHHRVIVEGSRRVRKAGIYHLTVHVSNRIAAVRRPLTVEIASPGGPVLAPRPFRHRLQGS